MSTSSRLVKIILAVSLLATASLTHAASVLDYLTDVNGKYTGPTVEDNIALMDKDKNGFADATEVRAYLELINGKGYESAILDRFEASMRGTSCNTPFAKDFYVNN
ncbi:MAG: hypothetical protein Q8K83_06570 [Methylotenera sp.]|nr:hypothetical protein [Methylotenera sp.]